MIIMKKKKSKLNLIKVFIVLLTIYLIVFVFLDILNIPIKNIYINGNNYLSDQEILRLAKIDKYPSFIKTTKGSIERKLKKNPLIKSVKVKKTLFGKVVININEVKMLFYNLDDNNKLILDNNKYLTEDKYLLPVLINYVPDKEYEKLIKKFSEIDDEVINKISEIEYKPSNIDSERFLLTMNDGIYVYLTLSKFTNINKYNSIIRELEYKKGILYLDSRSSTRFYFTSFEE